MRCVTLPCRNKKHTFGRAPQSIVMRRQLLVCFCAHGNESRGYCLAPARNEYRNDHLRLMTTDAEIAFVFGQFRRRQSSSSNSIRRGSSRPLAPNQLTTHSYRTSIPIHFNLLRTLCHQNRSRNFYRAMNRAMLGNLLFLFGTTSSCAAFIRVARPFYWFVC